jgi:hypothetical protein
MPCFGAACRIDPSQPLPAREINSINTLAFWVEQYRRFWDVNLDSIEAYLDLLQTKDEENDQDE